MRNIEMINYKLYWQNFSMGDFLVLSNTNGSNPCASYIDLRSFDRGRLVIDQTLYWHIAATEDEAIYITGLLNSAALGEAISDFQPEGGIGRRHIHTLPYKIIPPFNSEDDAHREVVEATRGLVEEWRNVCMDGRYHNLLNPNSGSLSNRRRHQQGKIKTLAAYGRYDAAYSAILG